MSKVHKNDVDYSVGMAKSHCGKCFTVDDGYCTHFIATKGRDMGEPGLCAKVEGEIKANYWCMLFKRAK